MIDGQGRVIDYIRISVTDRCNLRCVYCMPEEGIETVSHQEILTYDEIHRLVKVFAQLGVKKIKLTGGEPLARLGLDKLLKDIKGIPGIEQVTVTTNGVQLAQQMDALAKAGVDGINLSLDTLNPEVFKNITRRDSFDKVMEGIKEALKYPEVPFKINCVPMGFEGQDIVEVAELARQYPIHVRYIEMMPIGFGRQYDGSREDDILQLLKEKYGEYKKFDGVLGNGPGHYYEFPGFAGKIGFISAVSHKFCESCNRVRLTAQGYLKTCLQYDVGVDLKELLRNGAGDEEILKAAESAILRKPVGHQFTEEQGENIEMHAMSQIGG